MRPDLDYHDFVELRFTQCRRIVIDNALPASLVENPEIANWSLSEFAIIKLLSSEENWFHFAILWETDRRIDVECRGSEAVELPRTPELEARYRWPKLN
jgi:hypothetical protein